MNDATFTRKLHKLQRELGNKYTIKKIDGNECIYRNMGDYDVEILVGCESMYGKGKVVICLWQTRPYMKMIRQVAVSNYAVGDYVEEIAQSINDRKMMTGKPN